MYLWSVSLKLHSWSEPSTIHIAATTAEKAAEGTRVYMWVSNRSTSFEVLSINRETKIERVQK